MDFVYVCRSGDNEELRYSIRSIVKNAGAENIWVFGDKPDWYSGNFVYVEPEANRFKNTQKCLNEISNHKSVSSDFILMNDDFFIMKQLKKIPAYHGGSLSKKIEVYIDKNGYNQYSRLLADANAFIKRSGVVEPLDYDIHVPMKMNKKKLLSIVNKTLCPRSVYGNLFNVGGKEIQDVKMYKNQIKIDKSLDMISTNDDSFLNIQEDIKLMFPDKSDYEI